MSKTYNILYTSQFGNFQGGGQRSLDLLLENLNLQKYRPVLLCGQGGDFLESVRRRGISAEIRDFPPLRNLNVLRTLKAFFAFKKLIRNQNINLIHCDSPRWTFYLGIIAKTFKIPLIYHVRVSEKESDIYEKILFGLSSKIIAVSRHAKKRFQNFENFQNKVEVVYNALGDEIFQQRIDRDIRKELGIKDKVFIGMIGQMIALKGQEYFLQAVAEVIRHCQNVHFIIMGSDHKNYRQKLEMLIIKLSLEKYVTLMDFQPRATEVMGTLDVLVNASTLEGFSRVIIEAMALKKAVIATEVGGNTEAVEDNITGVLIPPENSEKLAEAMMTLIGDENKRKRMGDAGFAKVQKEFMIQDQVCAIEKIYEELLN